MAKAWSLEIQTASGRVKQHKLAVNELIAGRSESADIRLNHNYVSRQHAKLKFSNGRWTITDLQSRRGTRVNDKLIQEAVLSDGDLIQIVGYKIKLVSNDLSGSSNRNASISQWSYTDNLNAITTLGAAESPKIDLKHIAEINDLGRRLLGAEDSGQRLQLLCDIVAGPILNGLWAVGLEVVTDDWAPPRVLGSGPLDILNRSDIYISRTAIQAMLHRGLPVLATNYSQSDGVIGLTTTDARQQTAIITCPLEQTDGLCKVLYVSVPPEYATTQWLAIISLAGKEYQQAEAIWLQRQYAVVDRELDNARAIQQSILPKKAALADCEIDWSFQPCDAVGGDYLDVLYLPNQKVVVTIADVSGHGLSAALATLSVHSILQTSIKSGLSIEQTMETLNDHLCSYLPANRFVTMTIILVDLKSGQTNCVNAGHHPPLVVSASGAVRPLNGGSNLILGVDSYETTSAEDHLEVGDTMLLYTDGLIEMRQNGGDMLRTAGLSTLFTRLCSQSKSVVMLRESLEESILTLQGEYPIEDDQTFLIMRRS